MNESQAATDWEVWSNAFNKVFDAGGTVEDAALAGREASEQFRSSLAPEFPLVGASISKEKQGGCTSCPVCEDVQSYVSCEAFCAYRPSGSVLS